MGYNEELAMRIQACLRDELSLIERKMFGGLCFIVSGNMCCGVTGDDLMVRVGPLANDEALAMPAARPMDITGRPMKGFVLVGPEGTRDEESLQQWLELGLGFARSLPPK